MAGRTGGRLGTYEWLTLSREPEISTLAVSWEASISRPATMKQRVGYDTSTAPVARMTQSSADVSTISPSAIRIDRPARPASRTTGVRYGTDRSNSAGHIATWITPTGSSPSPGDTVPKRTGRFQ